MFNQIRYVNKAALKALKSILRDKAYQASKQGDYLVLRAARNSHLYQLLHLVGFFDFHVTNTQRLIVGLHQVVAYAYWGWKAYRNGFLARRGEVEVHHIDDNPLNNHPRNLIYVSPMENCLVAQAIRSECGSCVLHGKTIPFNRQGRLVKNPIAYFVSIVKLSIERTFAALGLQVEAVNVLLELPRDFGIARVSWAPRFFINALRKLGWQYG